MGEMSIFTLKGIDKIAEFAGFNSATIIDWIFFCDFPAKKTDDGIWVARKSSIRRWLKQYKPQKPVDHLTIRPEQKIKKRRW